MILSENYLWGFISPIKMSDSHFNKKEYFHVIANDVITVRYNVDDYTTKFNASLKVFVSSTYFNWQISIVTTVLHAVLSPVSEQIWQA